MSWWGVGFWFSISVLIAIDFEHPFAYVLLILLGSIVTAAVGFELALLSPSLAEHSQSCTMPR